MVELTPSTRVHFVGIGGVGMSALAELLHIRGCVVKGTDRRASELRIGWKSWVLRSKLGIRQRR